MTLEDFQPGEKVTYIPSHGGVGDHGIVKSKNHLYVFVVYKCAGNWDRYQDYTAAATDPNDLRKGWV